VWHRTRRISLSLVSSSKPKETLLGLLAGAEDSKVLEDLKRQL